MAKNTIELKLNKKELFSYLSALDTALINVEEFEFPASVEALRELKNKLTKLNK